MFLIAICLIYISWYFMIQYSPFQAFDHGVLQPGCEDMSRIPRVIKHVSLDFSAKSTFDYCRVSRQSRFSPFHLQIRFAMETQWVVKWVYPKTECSRPFKWQCLMRNITWITCSSTTLCTFPIFSPKMFRSPQVPSTFEALLRKLSESFEPRDCRDSEKLGLSASCFAAPGRLLVPSQGIWGYDTGEFSQLCMIVLPSGELT